MDRSFLLCVGAVALISTPAFAQTWPATIVAGAPQMATQAPSRPLTVEKVVVIRRAPTTAPTQPGPARRNAIVVRKPAEPHDVPEVEVRAKEAWLDDQGLRLSPTRVAFKHRF